MDDIGWIDKLLSIAAHWPDLTCVLVGSLAGWLLTLAFEMFVLPVVTDPARRRAQQGQTFLFCWLTSGTMSTLLWHWWDPKDPLHIALGTSFIVGIFPWFVYPVLAKIAAKYIPGFTSSWAPP